MFCTIRDTNVFYEIMGTGKPVLMVHGMGVDHRALKGCMESVFQDLKDDWMRIYFDLPGMGKTPGAAWIENSDDMARLVSMFVDSILPETSFAIAGYSYGGYLARAIVHERPQDVEGMLLIGPLVVPDDKQRDVTPVPVLWKDEKTLDTLEPEIRQLLDLFVTWQDEQNCRRFMEELGAGFSSGDGEAQARIRSKKEAYAFSFDLDHAYTPFTKPSLILLGRQDCLVGYRDAFRLVDIYPRASFAVLDSAGHAMHIDQAALFGALVTEWLDRMRREW
jgi:pimeloyl-ACP methyl ester carboxylesterase